MSTAGYSPIEIASTLPTDVGQLQQLYTDTAHRLNAVLGELSWLRRQVFGRKSERFIPNEAQLNLGLDVAETPPPVTTETISYDRRKVQKERKGHGRGVMPTHLPIEDIVIEPQVDVTGLEQIGKEESWELDYEPGQLRVLRYIRPKYVRRGDLHDDILIGLLPPRPIEKGNASAGLLAHVVVEKYVYHMPLDRQRRRFKNRHGVEIAESTLCDMVKHTGFWIEPLHRLQKEHVLSCSYLQADETPIPILVKGKKGKTHKGYFWVYYDPLRELVYFDYRRGRSRDGPSEMLKDFKGVLQVDGYAGYNEVLSGADMSWAACMAHVRRKFKDNLERDRQRAEYALKAIGKWFRRERMAKKVKMDPERRLAMRKKHIVPLMKEFHDWLKKESTLVLPQNPMRKAITYALNQWPGFTPFMTDGRVELSNNLVENAIRPVALGRNNYRFKGSHEAAKRAAMIYSLLATATRKGHDPFAYLKDTLSKLPAVKTRALQDFLPHNWKPEATAVPKAQADHVAELAKT